LESAGKKATTSFKKISWARKFNAHSEQLFLLTLGLFITPLTMANQGVDFL
jgi:hypothetical protein